MTNDRYSVFYVGDTSNLKSRIKEHIEKLNPISFTTPYNFRKLVYFECFAGIVEAIKRYKQIKGGSGEKKLELMNNSNPHIPFRKDSK